MFLLKHVFTEAILFIVLSLDICVDLAPDSPWISRSVCTYVNGKLLVCKYTSSYILSPLLHITTQTMQMQTQLAAAPHCPIHVQ